MADADEDLIPSLTKPHNAQAALDDDNASDSSADSDNAAPDYRYLTTSTSSSSSKEKHKLPSRGTKDFEPNPTVRQASTLDLSRKAMSDALSHVRTHNSKSGMVGVYFPNEADWDGKSWDSIKSMEGNPVPGQQESGYRKSGSLRPGEGRCVAVEKFTSTYSKTMGQSDRRNWVWLLPEEALFLLERGTLDIRWAASDQDADGESGENEEYRASDEHPADHTTDALREPVSEDQPMLASSRQDTPEEDTPRLIGTIPMSLQAAYASFIGKSGLTLDRYTVYANLRRVGYIVQRAPTWHGPIEDSSQLTRIHQPVNSTSASVSLPHTTGIFAFLRRLFSWLFSPAPAKSISRPCFNSVIGPLLSPGLFRSYGDIYRQLYLIPYHKYQPALSTPDSSVSTSSQSSVTSSPTTMNTDISTSPPLLPAYHLYKPSLLSVYRKSAPPPPSFRLVVIDSRSPSTSTIPTSLQIGNLLDRMPQEELSAEKRLETRIKHGTRNCLIAVVDSGLISYLRIAGGGFSGGGLWEENEKRKRNAAGGKRGGGQRGRGGGRGGSRGSGRGRGQGGSRGG